MFEIQRILLIKSSVGEDLDVGGRHLQEGDEELGRIPVRGKQLGRRFEIRRISINNQKQGRIFTYGGACRKETSS